MEKSQNSSAVFRIKLLQAAVHMQVNFRIKKNGVGVERMALVSCIFSPKVEYKNSSISI